MSPVEAIPLDRRPLIARQHAEPLQRIGRETSIFFASIRIISAGKNYCAVFIIPVGHRPARQGIGKLQE